MKSVQQYGAQEMDIAGFFLISFPQDTISFPLHNISFPLNSILT